MKNYILLSFGLLFLSACDRMSLDDSVSSIRIQIPSMQGGLSKIDDANAMGGGGPVPTTIAEFNCFMVAVSGPEAELSRNTCARQNPDGTYDPASIRHVGNWTGGVPSGGSLVLGGVPSGKDRVIHVIGFRTQSPADCHDFKGDNFPLESKISDPYLLGSSVNTELKGGEQEVQVKIAFTDPETQRFSSCKGPDFPDDNNNKVPGHGPGLNTTENPRVRISKDFFPYDSLVSGTGIADDSHLCTPIEVSVYNELDQRAVYKEVITLNATSDNPTTDISLYPSMQACNSAGNYMTGLLTLSVFIPAYEHSYTIAAKVKDGKTGTLNLTPSNFSLASIPAVAKSFQVLDNTAQAVRLSGPDQIVPGVCYPYEFRSINVKNYSPALNTQNNFILAFTASDLDVYSDLGCVTTATASDLKTDLSFEHIKKLYIKWNTSSANKSTVLTTSSAASNYFPMTRKIQKDPSSNLTEALIPKYLEVRGDGMIGTGGGSCYQRPFTVMATNIFHTPIPSIGNIQYYFKTVSNNSFPEFKKDSGCTDDITSGSKNSLPDGQIFQEIYLKTDNLSSGTLTLIPAIETDPFVSISGEVLAIHTMTYSTPSDPYSAMAVATGEKHNCMILTGGQLKCWGSNQNGQLGTNSTNQSNTPVPIIASGALSVALGASHSCAVFTNGELKCWGNNSHGQLGDGTTINKLFPVQIIASGVQSVALGAKHTCASLTGGQLKCWGYNYYGQLGDGTTVSRNTPNQIIASGVTSVALGFQHTCAILTGGQLKCWGDNLDGQLGDGSLINRFSPVQVIASGALSVALGTNHSCAILTGYQLKCWGSNYNGQLGDGTSMPQNAPPATPITSSVLSVALGFGHTCAVFLNGELKCWGLNLWGQLGDGTYTAQSSPPATPIASGVGSVALGFGHTCARLSDNTVKCWGQNDQGQLGDGTTNSQNNAATALIVLGGG